jgi:hypothetical protein
MKSRTWKVFLCTAAFAFTQHPVDASARMTPRDFMSLGLEFCMTAAEDPDRAAELALARGLIDSQPAADEMSFGPPGDGVPPLLRARVYRHESGDFAIECGFDASAVGEVTREEVEALASQFSLQVTPGENGRYAMTRRTPHLIVLAYAAPSEAMPCLDEGLTIAPEVLSEHPEVGERIAEVCGKPGFRMAVQGVYSRTELPR